MVRVVVNGLLLGSHYALLAVGYTLAFGVTRLLTLAHGELFVAAAVGGALAMRLLGAPLAVAVLVALAVGAAGGLLTDALCFRSMPGASPMSSAVATIGLALAIQGVMVALHGSDPVGLPSTVRYMDVRLGGIVVSVAQLAMLAVAVALMAGLQLVIRRTRWGAALRAMAEDPAGVRLFGVDPRRLATAVLVFSGAVAGLAGVLALLRVGSVSPFAGRATGLVGLAVMAIGGMGSVTGAMLAGLGVGVIE
ncbi:MAG: branched-chain amino acid ABC transporter permease, partial [Actinobacteria bacterium]|nr:branched-chain amino acid ABC transporter permease [Actinomycetota bacterium]